MKKNTSYQPYDDILFESAYKQKLSENNASKSASKKKQYQNTMDPEVFSQYLTYENKKNENDIVPRINQKLQFEQISDSDSSIDFELSEINNLNQMLEIQGYPHMGNILSNEKREVKQTLSCIRHLIEQLAKQINMKQDAIEKFNKFDKELQRKEEQLEKCNQSKILLEGNFELQKQKNQQAMENRIKEIDQLKNEVEQIQKKYNQLQLKDSQQQNEIRKQEIITKQLQDKLLTVQNSKQKDKKFLNSYFVISQCLNEQQLVQNNQDSLQYQNYKSSNIFKINEQLKNENNLLRELLLDIKKQMKSVMYMKKTLLQNKLNVHQIAQEEQIKINNDFENLNEDELEVQMNTINLDIQRNILELPFESFNEIIKNSIQRNLDSFKKFIDRMDEIDKEILKFELSSKSETCKIGCLKDISNMQNQYNNLIQNQNNLLEKSISYMKIQTQSQENVSEFKMRKKFIADISQKHIFYVYIQQLIIVQGMKRFRNFQSNRSLFYRIKTLFQYVLFIQFIMSIGNQRTIQYIKFSI